MKLICTQENFKRAIFSCERVVAKKNTLPILNNILFETEKGGLRLSATNLEIGVSAKVGAKVEKEGKITIPAKLISGFSNNLPPGENVALEVTEEKLKIKSGSNKAIIKGVSANDFPLIPSKKTEYLLDIPGPLFKEVLQKILPATALSEARQELTGINFTLGAQDLFLAATDSFRLAEYKMKLTEKNIHQEHYPIFIEKNNNIIVPANALMEINRIISPESGQDVKIAIEEGQVFFEVNGTKLVSRLINGKYPEYQHIMPKEYKTRIVGPKSLMQGAIKLASVFTSGGTSEIKLKIDSEAKKIFILSSSASAGENSTELNFDIVGPSQEIIFNAKYLIDGINAVESDQLAILANSSASPAAVKEIDGKTGEVLDSYTYIVMPIKN